MKQNKSRNDYLKDIESCINHKGSEKFKSYSIGKSILEDPDKYNFDKIKKVAISLKRSKNQQGKDAFGRNKPGYKHPRLGVHLTQETKDKISKANTGRVLTEEHKAKINPTGRKQPQSFIDKMSKRMKGSNNPMYGKKGELHPFFGKHHSEVSRMHMRLGQDIEAKRSANLTKKLNGSITSSPAELKIYNYLKCHFGDNCQSQFMINDKSCFHLYDIYLKLPNSVELLIEYDGRGFHRNNNPANDFRKIEAESHGYKFLIINQNDYEKGGLKFVKDKISEFYPPFKDMHLN